jgi:lipopolysaccharide biosynthesis regulator YciM
MPELVVLVLFIVALCVIEWWYVAHHQKTISQHVQELNEAMSKQLLAGIFFLLGAIAGWFVAHFADAVVR